jgi:nicotinamidase-related amidase
VIDKPLYSAFAQSGLYELLVGRGLGTIVVSDAETDVCVLATPKPSISLKQQRRPIAFSSEVDTGSREENASNKKLGLQS